MSETRYTDIDTAEPGTVEAVEQAYEVELAGLNENEQDQVHDALTEAEFEGELDQVDMDQEILDAQQAEELRDFAEDLREEQVKDIEAGDLSGAREMAQGSESALKEATDDHGGQLDLAVHEATHDVQALSEAEYQQETAEAFDAAAVEHAEDGHEDSSDMASDHADHAYDAADDYADQSDHDGSYADQTIHTDHD